MRFSFAFISALLSASTVPTQGFSPYAGFRVTTESTFQYSSALVQIPRFFCNGLGEPGAILFAGAAIGNPDVCHGGVEAGFSLACRRNPTNGAPEQVTNVYYRLYPAEPYIVDPETYFPLGIDERHVMYMTVRVDNAGVYVYVKNRSTTNELPEQHIGGMIEPIADCLTTAAWVLRATEVIDTVLVSIPAFHEIYFIVIARDIHDREYGTQEARGVEELELVDSDGTVWVRTLSIGPRVFRVY